MFWSCYRLVGDNIHISKAKIQTMMPNNHSINWMQQYAVLKHVNEPTLDEKSPLKHLKDIQLIELQQDKKVQENFKMRCVVIFISYNTLGTMSTLNSIKKKQLIACSLRLSCSSHLSRPWAPTHVLQSHITVTCFRPALWSGEFPGRTLPFGNFFTAIKCCIRR